MRLCFQLPVVALFLAFTFSPHYFKWNQFSNGVFTLLLGMSFIAMGILGQQPDHGPQMLYYFVVYMFMELRFWQATGGLISVAKDGHVMGWANATSGPDASILKPVFCGVDLPELGPMPRETFTAGAYWWKYERLHRRMMADYRAVRPELRAEFDAIEDGFFAEGARVMTGSTAEKQAFVYECWRLADEAADRWLARLERKSWQVVGEPAYAAMWQQFNAAAALQP